MRSRRRRNEKSISKANLRVRSRRENVLVYARPMKNDRMELMVFTQDGGDTVLVRVAVAAETLARELGDARKVSLLARR